MTTITDLVPEAGPGAESDDPQVLRGYRSHAQRRRLLRRCRHLVERRGAARGVQQFRRRQPPGDPTAGPRSSPSTGATFGGFIAVDERVVCRRTSRGSRSVRTARRGDRGPGAERRAPGRRTRRARSRDCRCRTRSGQRLSGALPQAPGGRRDPAAIVAEAAGHARPVGLVAHVAPALLAGRAARRPVAQRIRPSSPTPGHGSRSPLRSRPSCSAAGRTRSWALAPRRGALRAQATGRRPRSAASGLSESSL